MHDRKLRAVWEDCFRPALTRPGFISLVVLLSGWVLTDGTHAVTAALVATDVAPSTTRSPLRRSDLGTRRSAASPSSMSFAPRSALSCSPTFLIRATIPMTCVNQPRSARVPMIREVLAPRKGETRV